jgi:hypothetical protein
VSAKVSGEFYERGVFFANAMQNSDHTDFIAGQPDDAAPRPPEFALQWLYVFDGRMEMLLKKSFEDVHE